ncbi:hypothetical protein M2R48_05450 [Acinetobacter sp. I-MWF]|uniref:5'-methylthioadenosine/S-adenosylhomocysteine nucleosidase family protein n=1 Tax=Acinetobacter sp. I-MWF TaxID=2940517 RepID=UPI0021C96AB6|nr:hypothetical protein [Acinetobacter sp. I-MWF]MCT9977767.1 hypothetical protein [Acinetobacter sp. I-MWF]
MEQDNQTFFEQEFVRLVNLYWEKYFANTEFSAKYEESKEKFINDIVKTKNITIFRANLSHIPSAKLENLPLEAKRMLVYSGLVLYERFLISEFKTAQKIKINGINLAFAALRASAAKILKVVFKGNDIASGQTSIAAPLPQTFIPYVKKNTDQGWVVVKRSLYLVAQEYIDCLGDYCSRNLHNKFINQMKADISRNKFEDIDEDMINEILEVIHTELGAPLVYFVDPIHDKEVFNLLTKYKEKIFQIFGIQVIEWHRSDESIVGATDSMLRIVRIVFPQQEESTLSNNKLSADIVLLTVNDNETEAVHNEFNVLGSINIRGRTYWDLGEINGCRVFHTLTDMGDHGAAEGSNHAIKNLNPILLIGVGIAWGADSSKMNIGDILISKTLIDAAHEKIGPNQIISRGEVNKIDKNIWQNIKAAHVEWKRNGKDQLKIHMGEMLSRPTLIDNSKVKQEWLNRYPEAIGGEMEGRGIVLAANEHKCDWLIVKAICDWGEDKNKEGEDSKEQNQKLAANKATSFLKYVIEVAIGAYTIDKRDQSVG